MEQFDEKIEEVLVERADKKEINLVKSAIKNLKMALDDIKKADSLVKTDTYKYYKSSIEGVISADDGKAGLEPMLKEMEG